MNHRNRLTREVKISIPASVQSQVELGSEKRDPGEEVPVHGKGVATRLASPFQLTSFCDPVFKKTGPKEEPCGAPLVTGYHPDATPFTVTLCAQPISHLITHFMVCLPSCVLDILSTRILLGTVLKPLLKSKRMISTGFP